MKSFNAARRILSACVLLALVGSASAQQSFPGKPIRFIIPYAPGGSTTIMARLVGQKLADSWGQQVLVDNRPGGNTIIGSEAVAKSAPDGYTILLAGSVHVTNPSLYASIPYDAVRDFAPITTVAISEYILVLHPSLPANDLQEFIALAKSKPGLLNYGSSSTGGPTHLAPVLFEMLSGIKLQHIPYKGGGPAIVDLIGGQVQLAFANPANVISHVKTGKLKAIAVSGESRLTALPGVMTFTEAGLHGFSAGTWFGILAPVATPRAIIDKYSAEIARILSLPELKEKLDSQGAAPFASTPEQFAALIRSELVRYAKIIKAADIKLDN